MRVTKYDLIRARQNDISPTTVYNRLDRGWSLEDAITKPTKPKPAKLRSGIPYNKQDKGKQWSFRMHKDLDPILEKIIKESGLTASDWIAEQLMKVIKI